MSTPFIKLMIGVGLTCWLAGCSSMTGGSMVSSLNPFSGPKTFSNLSEPPVEGKMTSYDQDELVDADTLSEPAIGGSEPEAGFGEKSDVDSFVTAELDDWEASTK
ncbi:MAG: hypothetical protein CMJ46_09660 [Planctomyces sp.]|nr:hypothetical protein [Planctomyces sp.]